MREWSLEFDRQFEAPSKISCNQHPNIRLADAHVSLMKRITSELTSGGVVKDILDLYAELQNKQTCDCDPPHASEFGGPVELDCQKIGDEPLFI